jgi:hypothetical protein
MPAATSATPTNHEVYLALAALGGHLRSNGPPDWIVLGRAYEKLLVLAGMDRCAALEIRSMISPPDSRVWSKRASRRGLIEDGYGLLPTRPFDHHWQSEKATRL